MNIAERLFGKFMYWTALVKKTTTVSNRELYPNSPLSEAEKHPDFQVTSCYHFDTTNVNFAYIGSE
jgi:hypothetical protein